MRILRRLFSLFVLAIAMVVAHFMTFDWLDWWYWLSCLVFVTLIDVSNRCGPPAIGPSPICYWCEKEMRPEDLCVSKYGTTVHHDCYLEEQEGWQATAAEDL